MIFSKVARNLFRNVDFKARIRVFRSNHKSNKMEPAVCEPILAPLRERVKLQGDIVRKLKTENASAADIADAVNELKIAKKQLEDKESSLIMGADVVDENKLDQLIQCSSFYKQSFNLYGGVAGLYDYGWNGCGLKLNVLQHWRKFFVIEEDLLEIDCPVITPESVLKASGHVDRFSDYMVEDDLTGNGFRLDHLIKAALETLIAKNTVDAETRDKCKSLLVKLDGLSLDEMKAVIKEFDIKDPINGNPLGEPKEVNLMFKTQIGLHRPLNTFLRPELAQGIFVNFKNLLSTFNVRIPFGACQVGNAYRNEISPRNGLVRVREFPLAEIEYFYDPLLPTYRKFPKIKNTELLLYSACHQMDGQSAVRVSIDNAFKQGLIKNEILGYFLARIHLFLTSVGIDERKLRFRQHMKNEMAHYALDCWDAECLTNSGWLECVGCADRSAYDLTQHSKATGKRLTAQRSLATPKEIDTVEIKCVSSLIGKSFKNEAKKIFEFIHDLSGDELFNFKNDVENNGFYELVIGNRSFKIDASMVEFRSIKKNVHVEEFTPSVIEPSFGIGRIIHSVLEHKFRIREDADKRMYFSIPAAIATYKCSVLPLTKKITLNPVGENIVDTLCEELKSAGISTMLNDNSDTIGKRYTQMDQFGVPFGITIDFESLEKPHSLTLRERDSMTQVRVMLDEIVDLLDRLVRSKITWPDVIQKYPVV